MLKLSTAKLLPLLKQGLREYKYLSPCVYKNKKRYSLLYCNRKSRPEHATLLYRKKTGKNILYGKQEYKNPAILVKRSSALDI